MPQIDAYPLAWPAGWKRTAAAYRRSAKFHGHTRVPSSLNPGSSYVRKTELSVYESTGRVLAELKKFGVEKDTIIISTNIELRRDGLPRSDRRAPADPGVAVYWKNPDTNEQQCMAIDLYDSVAGNLAAVAATIDAMRAIERHGGATILNRAFKGFTALPASTTTALSTDQAALVIARRMADVVGGAEAAAKRIVSERTYARDAIRVVAGKTHPDAGGSTADFQLVQEAKRVLEAHHGGPL